MLAAINGYTSVVTYLIERCKVDANKKNMYGETALICASCMGHETTVKYLIKAKCDVNTPDKFGCTVLMIASWNGHENIVRYLVNQCDVDVNQQDKNRWTALNSACQRGYESIVRYLLEDAKIYIGSELYEPKTSYSYSILKQRKAKMKMNYTYEKKHKEYMHIQNILHCYFNKKFFFDMAMSKIIISYFQPYILRMNKQFSMS